jgi:hypothetical protein
MGYTTMASAYGRLPFSFLAGFPARRRSPFGGYAVAAALATLPADLSQNATTTQATAIASTVSIR